jgi:hypothetical protein
LRPLPSNGYYVADVGCMSCGVCEQKLASFTPQHYLPTFNDCRLPVSQANFSPEYKTRVPVAVQAVFASIAARLPKRALTTDQHCSKCTDSECPFRPDNLIHQELTIEKNKLRKAKVKDWQTKGRTIRKPPIKKKATFNPSAPENQVKKEYTFSPTTTMNPQVPDAPLATAIVVTNGRRKRCRLLCRSLV